MKQIDKAVLIKLYCEDKKTAFEIAKIYSCGTSTILRHLRWLDIPIRSISDIKTGKKLSPEHKAKVIKNLVNGKNAMGANNPAWKGGRAKKGRKKDGQYILLRMNGVYVAEHRYVMELYLGRKLTSKEHVHHINGDKTDNKVENLQVMSNTEHLRLHHQDPEYIRRKSESMIKARSENNWSTKKK